MATTDTVEVHIKGFGFTYDGKITSGDSVEAEKARKFTLFLLDLASGEPMAPTGGAKRPRKVKAETADEAAPATDTELETL